MGNGATFIELNSAVCLLTGLILGKFPQSI